MSAGKVVSFLKKREAFRTNKEVHARKQRFHDEMIDEYDGIFDEDLI